MAEHLRDTGVTDDQIIEMNFESMSIPDMDARGFYEYVKGTIQYDLRLLRTFVLGSFLFTRKSPCTLFQIPDPAEVLIGIIAKLSLS